MKQSNLMKIYKVGERPEIYGASEAHKELKELFSECKEYFICLHLDSKNKVICREIVHIGGLNSTIIEPRCIFRNAISLNANAIIVAHNHPSGDVTPSKEDLEVQSRLIGSGEILGIKVLDHIIFSKNEFKSIIGMGD